MSMNEASCEAWRSALLPEDSTLKDAISCLDRSSMQVAIVINGNGRLVGTLTDGDIRRGLLRGLELSSPVAGIIHRDPIVVPPQWGRDMVLQLMQANKVHQLPVVDDERRVVGLHVWDELLAPVRRPNVMVIMAGGRGRRLMPHTEICPKPMLPVRGKPMLQHIIERARSEGVHRFVLTVHYLGHMVESHFGDGRGFGVEIEYVREDRPLGTAGALSLLGSRPQDAFLVTNGDVLSDVHYGELLDYHHDQRAMATMAIRQHEWQHPFGVVRIQGVAIVGFEEKPVLRSHINAGIYVLEPAALAMLDFNEHCDMPALFARLQRSGERVVAYPIHEVWMDVGMPDDLLRADDRQSPDAGASGIDADPHMPSQDPT